MTLSVLTEKIVTEHGAMLIRFRERDSVGDIQYDTKPTFTGSKRGWTLFDSFTASAVQAVYKAVNPANQAKFNRIPLAKLLPLVWKSVGVAK